MLTLHAFSLEKQSICYKYMSYDDLYMNSYLQKYDILVSYNNHTF